jgi:hypothetical protein
MDLLFKADLVKWIGVIDSIEAMTYNLWCSFAVILWGIKADNFFEEMIYLLYFFERYLIVFALVW